LSVFLLLEVWLRWSKYMRRLPSTLPFSSPRVNRYEKDTQVGYTFDSVDSTRALYLPFLFPFTFLQSISMRDVKAEEQCSSDAVEANTISFDRYLLCSSPTHPPYLDSRAKHSSRQDQTVSSKLQDSNPGLRPGDYKSVLLCRFHAYTYNLSPLFRHKLMCLYSNYRQAQVSYIHIQTRLIAMPFAWQTSFYSSPAGSVSGRDDKETTPE
jgi:hypothetical protein